MKKVFSFALLCFALCGIHSSVWAQYDDAQHGTVYTICESPAQFPGGEDSMRKFIKENFKYPEAALQARIEGTVYVSCIVENDGMLTNFKVLKGLGYGCDEEAVNVVKLMPQWTPAKIETHDGEKKVRFAVNIPINFVLPPTPRN